jgi:hypothetical protein
LSNLLISGQLEKEAELRALARLGPDSNHSIKGLDDVFRNHKAQPNALCIHLSSVLETAEEFEQLTPVFLFDADASINHWDHELVLLGVWPEHFVHAVLVVKLLGRGVIVTALWAWLVEAVFVLLCFWERRNQLGHDSDGASIFCELQGVRLQVNQHLLDPFLVGINQQVLLVEWDLGAEFALSATLLGWESNELSAYRDILRIGLVLLDRHDFVDRSFDVELHDALHKLARFQLGETEDVFDVEQQQVWAWCHDGYWLLSLLVDFIKLLPQSSADCVLVDFDSLDELGAQSHHDTALVDDRVKWVPHFMRYRRVNQWQQFSFGLRCVVENLLADIVEAKHYLVFSSLLVHVLDQRLFELEEPKSWQELLFDAAHALEPFDYFL